MKLPQPVRRYGLRVVAGGIAAIGLTSMMVLPSAATPDIKAQFGRLDANSDGVLSVEEFLGSIDKNAKAETRNVVIESHITTSSDFADAKSEISVSADTKRDAFSFWLPEELGGAKDAGAPQHQAHEFKFIGSREVKHGEPGATTTRTMSFSLDDMRKDEFAEIDLDKDSKVSLSEYQARQTAMLTRGFEVLDANSDKALSEEEYAKIVAPPMVKINWTVPDGADMPEPPKVDIPGMKAVSPEAIKAAFTRLDRNKDGKLSLQEYLPAN